MATKIESDNAMDRIDTRSPAKLAHFNSASSGGEWPRRSLLLVVGALVCVNGHAAEEQASTAAPTAATDSGLEEIVVTAERRPAHLQDVAASVSAISGDTIRAAGMQSLTAVLSTTPFIDISQPYGDGGPPNIAIRGISSTDFYPSQSKPVAIYTDDAVRNFQLFEAVPMFDVERVEVLRGPQGTLYGRNATGGAVSIISKQPGWDTEGYVTVGYGEFDRVTTQGALQMPIIDHTLSARFAWTYTHDDGEIENLYPGAKNPSQTDVLGFRGELRYKVGDVDAVVRLTHSLAGGRDYTALPRNIDLASVGLTNLAALPGASRNGVGFYQTNIPLTPERQIESNGVNVHVNWTPLADVTVTSVTSVDVGKWTDNADNDGLPLELSHSIIRGTGAHQFMQDLHAGSSSSDPFNWQAGLLYTRDSINPSSEAYYLIDPRCGAQCMYGITPTGYGSATSNEYHQERHGESGYLRLDYALTGTVKLTGGVRRSHDNLHVDNYNAFLGDSAVPFAIPTIVNQSRSGSFSNTSWEGGIEWHPDHDLLIYGNYKQGYRGGAANAGAYSSPAEITIAPPEKAATAEIGMKATLLDSRWILDLAAFTTNYKNQQIISLTTTESGALIFPLVSIPRAEIDGVEVDSRFRVSDRVTVNASIGAIDPTYREGTLYGESLVGKQMQSVSRFTGTAGTDITLCDSGGFRCTLGANANYLSTAYFDTFETPDLKQPSYWLFNAHLGVEFSRYELNLLVNNAFDEKYTTYGANVQSAGFNYFGYGTPRWYGATFTTQF